MFLDKGSGYVWPGTLNPRGWGWEGRARGLGKRDLKACPATPSYLKFLNDWKKKKVLTFCVISSKFLISGDSGIWKMTLNFVTAPSCHVSWNSLGGSSSGGGCWADCSHQIVLVVPPLHSTFPEGGVARLNPRDSSGTAGCTAGRLRGRSTKRTRDARRKRSHLECKGTTVSRESCVSACVAPD